MNVRTQFGLAVWEVDVAVVMHPQGVMSASLVKTTRAWSPSRGVRDSRHLQDYQQLPVAEEFFSRDRSAWSSTDSDSKGSKPFDWESAFIEVCRGLLAVRHDAYHERSAHRA